MIALVSVAVGAHFAIATWMLLGRDTLRMTMGVYIVFNGVNLAVMAVAAVEGSAPPFAQAPGPQVDPLVQAMVLTAIVIGFGVATFLLTLAARLGFERDSLDARRMDAWRR